MESLTSPALLSAAIGIAITISVIVGLSARTRQPTIQAFFWGNSSINPIFTSVIILCSSYSLNGVLYQVWLGYSIGWLSLVTQLLWSGGFIFLALQYPKFSSNINAGSMHGILGIEFDSATRRLAAIASAIGFSLLVGWEVSVGVSLFSDLLGGGLILSLILSYFIVFGSIIYTTQSGLRGNARVNMLNNIVKSIGLLVPLAALLLWYPSSSSAVSSWASYKTSWKDIVASIQSLTVIGLIVNLFFSFTWQMIDMTVWQNLSATMDRKGNRVIVLGPVLN